MSEPEMREPFPFHGKVFIGGIIECVTGLHVGAPQGSLEIGGVDNPVIRDPRTGAPYLPGSSIKGKLRSLAERAFGVEFNRSTGNGYRHECNVRECMVCRVFGSTRKKDSNGENIPSRLRVRDAFLTQESLGWMERMDSPTFYTELKYENSLDRVTCAANPRPVERVPAGAEFHFELVYDVDKEEEYRKDLDNLVSLMRMLEDDYLGGNGSRGHGKVRFKDLKVVLRPRDFYFGRIEEETLQVDDVKELQGKLEELDSLIRERIFQR